MNSKKQAAELHTQTRDSDENFLNSPELRCHAEEIAKRPYSSKRERRASGGRCHAPKQR